MERKTLKLRRSIKSSPLQVNDRVKSEHIILEDFKEHFEEFISLKTLEGVAQRTISDYLKKHKYIMNFIEGMTRSSINHVVDIHLLRSNLNYIHYIPPVM